MFDPIRLAEQAKEAYALHFMGRYHHKMIDVFDRLVVAPDSPFSRRDEFMKVRGPYLQALPLSSWSDSNWEEFARSVRGDLAPDGLRPEVFGALSAMGFKRLHQFQEAAVRRICDDKDTLVVAATGRGKSESWLIPIFHFIAAEKLAGRIKGTKALLLYPTKALAQDQFRRIIGYLLEINRRLPKDRPITVGILDGDTPFENDQYKVAFLRTAFQFMDCPGKGTKEACKACPQQQVTVDPVGERLVLAVSQNRCRQEMPLDFVYLTREDVRDGEVDIVLTNPDLLNFQLININNTKSRKQLIADPKFIVLDEVHTYSGLFGNFTAALLRRLKLVRQELGQSDHALRFIAASATVANKKEIFQQLCGVSDPDCVVEEVAAPLAEGHAVLPPGLASCRLDEDELVRAAQEGGAHPYGGVVDALGLHVPELTRLELVEVLLERIVHSDRPEWDWVRLIYRHMNEQTPLPHELQQYIREEFALPDDEAAAAVLHNFIIVGGLAGLLERRAHLFAWALDGYYKCPDCDAVYTAPVAACKCGQEFISRFAFCTHCGEEVVEAWACPACRSVYPMIASRNGEAAYFDAPVCHCSGTDHETIRCMIHPDGRSRAITCPQCGAWTAAEGAERVCTNPACDWHGPRRVHGHARAPRHETVRRCLACGHSGTERDCPSCGARTQPSQSLKWVTTGNNDYLNALFQVETVVNDQSGRSFLPDMNPALAGAVRQDTLKQTYQVIDRNWQVREAKDASEAILPCNHPNAGWRFDRFNPMVRTPENILATSSQFLLRSLLQENGEPMDRRLNNAKMLTFSDSIRDMEAVNRNFNEPEREHFLQALTYSVLKAAGGQLTLADLADRVLAAVERYGAEVYEQAGRMEIFANLAPTVPSKVRRSAVEGMVIDLIRPSRRNSWAPSSTVNGICNIWPDGALLELPAAKREALGLVWKSHQGRWANDVLEDKRLKPEVCEAIRRLFHEDGVLVEERSRLYVDRKLLHVALVGPTHPANWDPWTDRFVTTADLQLAGRSRDRLVRYALSLEERAVPWSRHFTVAAYELLYSPAALLVSRVYKGDTAREVRRRIEFEFKNRSSLHHISSGPAMEVGVDIGNLNVMALYGTPPNINAYLQRIGRAGRKSKRALVFTVSKSNPIDFYYHREPRKLIASGAQPVPLTISNQEVTRISLTWAVLDFIATKYWVPWVKSTFEDVSFVEATAPVVRVGAGPAPKYLKLTNLLFGSLREVDQGRSLSVLDDIVTGNRSDISHWLRRLLGPEIPSAEADELVDGVLRDFAGNIYGFVERLQDELDALWDGANQELDGAKRKYRLANPRDRAMLDKRMRQLRQTLTDIEGFRDSLESKSLFDVQQMTEQKRYAYSLRNVSNNVTVYLRQAGDGEDEQTAGMEALTARELGLALREYFPAAVVLRDEQPHVVVEMHEAEFPTLELREQFGDYRWACENCGTLLGEDHPGTCPRCGENQRIRRAEMVVPGRVVIAPGSAVLQENPVDGVAKLTAQMLYRTAGRDTDIKATYPESAEQALPIDQVDEEVRFGDLTLGFAWVNLATFVHGFSAVYDDGRWEPPSLLEVCGEPHCGGVYKKGAPSFCSRNPTHDAAKKRHVVLGHNFRTRSIVITVNRPGTEAERMAHTVSHGLRMALQHVAGVDIRQLGELNLGRGRYLVYEDVEGGYGIVDLLRRVDESGRRTHLNDAMDLVQNIVNSTCCDDGCPYCLMQYGCTHRNRIGEFAKQRVQQMLRERGHGGGYDTDGTV